MDKRYTAFVDLLSRFYDARIKKYAPAEFFDPSVRTIVFV